MESEKVTQKTRIDERVRDAAWTKRFNSNDDTTKHKHHAVEEMPTDNGPADYGLFEPTRRRWNQKELRLAKRFQHGTARKDEALVAIR